MPAVSVRNMRGPKVSGVNPPASAARNACNVPVPVIDCLEPAIAAVRALRPD